MRVATKELKERKRKNFYVIFVFFCGKHSVGGAG
jgi:hypothetical protein